MHIYRIWKDGNDDPKCKTAKETQIQKRLLGSMGEGKGGMIWENSIEAYTLPYVKQISSRSSVHETGHSTLVHWDDPEGWDGEGGRRDFGSRGHMYTRGWFMSMDGKNHRLPCSSNSKESACDVGDQGSIPGLWSFSGEGNGNPLQYSCLENSMDREIWWVTVHGVTKSWTWLSN